MTRNSLPAVLGTALLLLLPTGCAKGPPASPTGSNSGGVTGKQLVVTMRVRGQVDLANDYYFVVFNVGTSASPNGLSRNGFNGPVPVVTDFERGGNGFAGGAFTTFVECHQNEPQSSNFGIYATDPSLLQRNYLAKPVSESVSGNTITFQMPLADIATATSQATGTQITESQITSLEVNFIATNVVPTDPNNTSIVKYFDALGAPQLGQLNAFVTLQTAQDTTYTNDTLGGSEPTDDVATYVTNTSDSQTNYSSSVQVVPDQTPPSIANLDIADASSLPAWSIEIRG